ncbi:MAG TPA: MerR family transcriptional regulator [Chitinophagales bacterium]|nr:MerR family transcriptional regulator [Chitinophagales bacterium]HNJ89670.1 MerR family transcriptional regulator [Chitinophagales bacterium]HNK99339.1 MerR family transcriptional regulator [Chitinophagales bacterium]HNM09720.1 MerR family transcriptional regulator [Chitinophagales bacterium]HNM30556.1 MerR family transcriptional regulator [Chitinophagales bacterium]
MSAIYSIRDLESLSGIKAHTIRIWEQRYGILKAARTETNIRYYSETELKYLMSLALLNRNGFKISKLAIYSPDEIAEKVEHLINEPQEFHPQIEALTLATMAYDEEKFDKVLNTTILQMGLEAAMRKVIFPYLDKLGMLWVSGSVIAAQEHFMTQLLRQKLIVAIDGQIPHYTGDSLTYVLFLPNGEWHELGLLFLHYLLKSRNHRVIYLGPSVPLQDVLQVGESLNPNAFYTVLTKNPNGFHVVDYLNKLAEAFPCSTVFSSGSQVAGPLKGLASNVKIIDSIDSIVDSPEVLMAENR